MTDATLTWTDERVERLKALWQEGKSASFIAAELGGVSRNAVIGKVHRLGLSGRGKAPEKAPPARPPVKQKPAVPETLAASAAAPEEAPAPQPLVAGATALAFEPQAETAARPEAAPRPAPRPAPATAADVVVPISERVTIMDLRESMCRWPIGDPSSADFRFCGARSLTGMPYCDCHAQIAYQPSADRRRDRKLASA